ncbi:MAG: DUF5723 family protein [Flavobacteriales bacterium]|jgi:hypothetical protein
MNQFVTRFLVGGAFSLLLVANAQAQSEASAFTLTGHGVATPFATDYQTLGINPANLDLPSKYEGKRFAIGSSEIGASLYSGILSKPQLRQNIFNGDIKNMTQEEQRQMAVEFANSNNSADIDVMSFGFSAQTDRWGSFAFSVRERVDYYSKLGPKVSELLWLGYNAPYFEQLILQNGDTIANSQTIDQATLDQVVQGITLLQNSESISELLQGTRIRMQWVREFNLGYGKRILSNDNWQLHIGVGGKLLVGQGLLDVTAQNGTAQAYSALSPVFQIDYSGLATNNPSALNENAGKLTPVGMGYGLDFGATFMFKDKFIVSAAVTDIGKMTWDGNVYSLNDVNLTEFNTSGIESVDFIDQIDQLNGTDGLLTWQGDAKLETKLPAMWRFGFGAYLGKKFKLGVDIVNSMNEEVGSLDKAIVSFGGEFSPLPWVHLSAGFMQGGNYDSKVPAGITFSTKSGSYECGIASRDVVTFFTEDAPTISASIGFMRFRF